jgi:hypothetical protein
MGWDAYATQADGSKIDINWNPGSAKKAPKIRNRGLHKAFGEAADRVKAEVGSYDWLLPLAGLDCSGCAHFLEQVTGLNAWSEEGWSAEKVKDAFEVNLWDFDGEYVGDIGLAKSAYEFMRVCSEQGLAVRFSW